MNQSISQVNQFAKTRVDITRWCRKLENKLSQSLEYVEFSKHTVEAKTETYPN